MQTPGRTCLIDLHCHLLFGIDDGARDIEMSVAMARMAVADGIETVVCTPHVMPGVYDNTAEIIGAALQVVERRLEDEGVELTLMMGADVHIDPAMLQGLRDMRIPTLNGSRYFLFEPPHHVAPPRIEDTAFSLMTGGYVPILTHPERLTWIENHYPVMLKLADMGVLMQITAGSLTGRFGRRCQYWADRMLDEGLVSLIASDAHNLSSRPLRLSTARDLAAQRLGETEAIAMVSDRPRAMIDNAEPSPPLARQSGRPEPKQKRSLWSRLGLAG